MPRYPFATLLLAAIRSPHLFIRYLRGKDPSEIELSRVARHVTSQSPVVVEAGAYNGVDTENFAKLWPTGNVYAFEPIPNLFSQIIQRVKKYPNVTVFPEALIGETKNTVEIHTYEDSSKPHGSSSILEPTLHKTVSPSVTFGRTISVPAVTLDNWVTQNNIQTIDLLWLDLQGAELTVLGQGEKALQMTKVCHIEVSRQPLYAGAATFDKVHSLMCSFGFRLALKRIPVISGNALYVKESNE